MKNAVFAALLIVCLVLIGLLWHRVSALETAAAAPVDFPLGENMGYLQRYADKVWYAGQAGNWDLARYYHDELAETADGIMAANLTKDGIPISHDMTELLPPSLAGLNEAITKRDATLFRQRYDGMVEACNTCHTTAKHPFIHVTVPNNPPTWWNQDFGGRH